MGNMSAPVREDRLYIRLTSMEKATLAEAARRRHLNASQFVLQTSLDAAQALLAEENIIRMSPEAYDEFARRLEEPPRDKPRLRALLRERLLFDE